MEIKVLAEEYNDLKIQEKKGFLSSRGKQKMEELEFLFGVFAPKDLHQKGELPIMEIKELSNDSEEITCMRGHYFNPLPKNAKCMHVQPDGTLKEIKSTDLKG